MNRIGDGDEGCLIDGEDGVNAPEAAGDRVAVTEIVGHGQKGLGAGVEKGGVEKQARAEMVEAVAFQRGAGLRQRAEDRRGRHRHGHGQKKRGRVGEWTRERKSRGGGLGSQIGVQAVVLGHFLRKQRLIRGQGGPGERVGVSEGEPFEPE